MKSLITILCSFILLCTSCQDQKEQTEQFEAEPENLTLEGAWEMVGFYNYDNNVIVDSFNTQNGYKQVKMFTDNKVMWSKKMPSDSTDWFGYGSYILKDSTLLEIMDYGSKIMNQVIAERKEFKYQIILDKNEFSQIEMDEDGNLVYSENYRRID